MPSDSLAPRPSLKMLEMSLALGELRNSWFKLSLIHGEMETESESPLRDELLSEVERYLTRLRVADQ